LKIVKSVRIERANKSIC